MTVLQGAYELQGEFMENEELIYLDSYLIQQDMRIRLPKSISENLQLQKGVSKLHIYLDTIIMT